MVNWSVSTCHSKARRWRRRSLASDGPVAKSGRPLPAQTTIELLTHASPIGHMRGVSPKEAWRRSGDGRCANDTAPADSKTTVTFRLGKTLFRSCARLIRRRYSHCRLVGTCWSRILNSPPSPPGSRDLASRRFFVEHPNASPRGPSPLPRGLRCVWTMLFLKYGPEPGAA